MTRRHRIALFLALALLGTACAWPMDRYDPGRTGHNPVEQLIGVTNVGTLVPSYTAPLGIYVSASPVVWVDMVYVADDAGRLYAISSTGDANCAGDPKVCQPLWTAELGDATPSAAAVDGETVYVGGDRLYAFSARGSTNCSGAPKVCQPLWTAETGGGTSSPLVVNGVVYVGSGDRLLAFDALGEQGCSGTPRTCQPLWTAPTLSSTKAPAYAGGVVYVTASSWPWDMALLAFDAAGITNCTGSPRSCEPLWTASIPCSSEVCDVTAPAVDGGRVFVGYGGADEIGPSAGRLFAFDTSGKQLWAAWTNTQDGAPSIADGTVYVNGYWYDNNTFESGSLLEAWNADGPGCIGCWSWTAELINPVQGSTSVANGLVYAVEAAGRLSVYDAAGVMGCSGVPARCEALWETELDDSVYSSPTVVNGRVYVAAYGTLHVFTLPQLT